MIKKFLMLALVMLLMGCATVHDNSGLSPTIVIAPGQSITLPTPAAMGFDVTATQILTAQYTINQQTKSYSTQLQVEKTPTKLTMVALTGWGGQAFSIDYDGVTIHSSSLPMAYSAQGIQHTLVDFLVIYAPTPVLNSVLKPTAITLVATSKQRILKLDNKVIMQVDYQNSIPWKGTITLKNFVYHYQLQNNTASYQLGKVAP
ncbi:MAG: DUF3261 domain-containing protein [Gammaproteobacteria bacterium]|nr:DUF3261 domain-containing protein [Gammaproteobacteria bacterium]